jgi:hypothetical protein
MDSIHGLDSVVFGADARRTSPIGGEKSKRPRAMTAQDPEVALVQSEQVAGLESA